MSTADTTFWNSLEWPLETWARENFSLLAETRFEIVYGWLEQELVDYACVEWSTLRCENSFRLARERMTHNPQKSLDAVSLWHTVAYGNTLHVDVDRPVYPISQAARAASCGVVNENMFRHERQRSSIAEAQLEHLTSPEEDFPTNSPASVKNVSLKTHALVAAGGDWNLLQKIWLSALVVEGSIITREVGVVFLVCHASAFGFIGIRVRLVAK